MYTCHQERPTPHPPSHGQASTKVMAIIGLALGLQKKGTTAQRIQTVPPPPMHPGHNFSGQDIRVRYPSRPSSRCETINSGPEEREIYIFDPKSGLRNPIEGYPAYLASDRAGFYHLILRSRYPRYN